MAECECVGRELSCFHVFCASCMRLPILPIMCADKSVSAGIGVAAEAAEFGPLFQGIPCDRNTENSYHVCLFCPTVVELKSSFAGSFTSTVPQTSFTRQIFAGQERYIS